MRDMDYSEKELLLLSNFVYIPVCRSDDTIKNIIDTYRDDKGAFTDGSVAAAAAGGGMSAQDVAKVFTAMDEQIRLDPDFGNLSASRKLESKDVRAVCYTDPKDESPVIAFRGTGGTKNAWQDNFEGAYLEDTYLQKVADEFVRNECAAYNDIVVTGHSKGGNLAMYVTVMEPDMAQKCVSFDGQGFSDEFLEKYAGMIDRASSKIKSVSAYNDFVNILLTGIAGTCVYVANESSAAAAHSSVTLLSSNSFDDEGNFISTRDQGAVAASLDLVADGLCRRLSGLDDNGKEVLSHIAGSTVSKALTTPKDDLAGGCIIPSLADVGINIAMKLTGEAGKMTERISPAMGNVSLDPVRTLAALTEIEDMARTVGDAVSRIDRVRQTLAYTMSARISAEYALERSCSDLERTSRSMERFAHLSKEAVGMYVRCEQEACALMRLKESHVL